MEKEIKCRFCGSHNFIKKGFRKTQNRGKIQKYLCRECNKFFVLDNGFFKMKNAPQKITLCLDLFYKGVSTRRIQEHLQAFYPHNSSHMSIYRWVLKYAKQISKFTDNLRLNVGAEIQIDEVEYHRRKSHKQKLGNEKNWFIDSICPKTKFMIASNYFKSRNMDDIKSIIKDIKNKTENQVKVITSDGWLAYPMAIQKVYGFSNKTHKVNINHHIVNGSRGDGFNYPVERLHNSLRQRTQNFRGFHGSVESAKLILKGFEIYYNFIRKHQTLGKTPSELATDIKLENPNKWLELIRLSCQLNN